MAFSCELATGKQGAPGKRSLNHLVLSTFENQKHLLDFPAAELTFRTLPTLGTHARIIATHTIYTVMFTTLRKNSDTQQ